MMFWIAIGVVAVLLVVGFIATFTGYRDLDDTWGWFVGAVMAAVVFLVVILGGSTTVPTHPVLKHRYELHALVTKDSTSSELSGAYFLGFGGVQGSSSAKTTIVYIRVATDGGATIHDTTVGRSVIYEDRGPDQQPYVEDWVSSGSSNGRWVPWNYTYTVSGEEQHRFHVPKGSIYEGYEVKP